MEVEERSQTYQCDADWCTVVFLVQAQQDPEPKYDVSDCELQEVGLLLCSQCSVDEYDFF